MRDVIENEQSGEIECSDAENVTHLFSFLLIVLMALSFLSSNIRVPAASSTIPRISGGRMFKTYHRMSLTEASTLFRHTFVIFPCMIKKLGLFILS